MTDALTLPQPILLPRHITGPVSQHLQLPLGALGAALIEHNRDAAFNASVVQWWNSQPNTDITSYCIAALAAPVLLADIRAYFRQTSQIRTWALSAGLEEDAPWLFFAPIREENDYLIQPVAGREIVVNSLLAYIQAGSPVWESGIRFQCSVLEFSVLIALADVYSRTQYASLILHQVVPKSLSAEDILQGYDNVTNYPDQRYLFPAIAHLLPEPVRQVGHKQVLDVVRILVERGLMQMDRDHFAWTDGGHFFVESLHRRMCALAIDIAGAAADGKLGTRGALFVRADQVLWFCDIEPSPTGSVTVVSIGLDTARQLLDEALTPLGKPPLLSEFEKPTPVAAAPSPPPVSLAQQAPAAKCHGCGSKLDKDSVFCSQCGVPVEQVATPPKPSPSQVKVCSNCNQPVRLNSKFCGGCGKTV